MKLTNIVAAACSLTLLVPSLAAQESATQNAIIAPLAAKSVLLDIQKNDKQVVAVGERGHILTSNDGQNWTQQAVPSQATLNGVFPLNEKIWAVGHDATILHSQDSGKSWVVQQFLPEIERPLFDVVFFDEQHGIAVGAYGVFFRTRDGGQTWQREYHPSFLHPDDREYVESLKEEDMEFYKEEMASILPHLNRLYFSNGKLYAAGEIGLLAVSDDFGQSWQRIETDYYGSFFDVRELPSGEVMAAGLRGSVYRSNANHSEWQRLETNTTSTFNSIVPLDDTRVLLIGNNGTKLIVQGESITQEQTEDGKALVAATQFNNAMLAVSEVGIKQLSLNK